MAYTTAGLFAVAMRLWTMWYYESGTQSSRAALHVTFGALSTLPAWDCWHRWDQSRAILRAFFSLVVINSTGGWVFATDVLGPLENLLNLPNLSHAFMHVMAIYGAHVYGKALTKQWTLVTE